MSHPADTALGTTVVLLVQFDFQKEAKNLACASCGHRKRLLLEYNKKNSMMDELYLHIKS